jgi:hypothetical protein
MIATLTVMEKTHELSISVQFFCVELLRAYRVFGATDLDEPSVRHFAL